VGVGSCRSRPPRGRARSCASAFEQFKRWDLCDLRLVALFLDATYLAVRHDGPKEGVLVAWEFTEDGEHASSDPGARLDSAR
jgi:hypothetical protein